MYSRLRSNPYASSTLKALAWFPVVVFFVDHGFSYATVEGRSMQVRGGALDPERARSLWGDYHHLYSQPSIQTPTYYDETLFCSTNGQRPTMNSSEAKWLL